MDTNSTITGRTTTNSISSVRYMSVTAMLSAVAFILMFLDFSVPFMPAFIKMDLSELPALIGAFSMGPVCGILICLIKNVLHLFITTTGGVGELSNFLLGVAFVLPAGLIYRHKKSRRSALIGSLLGAVIMGVFSVVSNYFLVYPVYYNFMPEEAVLGAYQVIVPSVISSSCPLALTLVTLVGVVGSLDRGSFSWSQMVQLCGMVTVRSAGSMI